MIAPLAPISPSISFPESIKICLKGYANFNGRGRRSEFWWFYLLCIIINAVLIGIIFAFITYDCSYGYHYYICVPIISTGGKIYLGFYALFDIAILIPLLAASTRRLHDIGYSGYYNYLFMIPIANFFLLYLWTVDSQVAPNIYGPSPKYVQKVSLINNNIPLEQPLENQQQLLTNETGSKPFISGEQNNNQLRQKPNNKQKITINDEQYNKSNDKKVLINDEKDEDSKDKKVNLIPEEEHKEPNEEKEEIINVEAGENNIDKDETSSKEENNN